MVNGKVILSKCHSCRGCKLGLSRCYHFRISIHCANRVDRISADPVDGGIVVNVADFLMRWTNGVYKSTVHRVINKTNKERYSVPLFFSINYDEKVETLPSCVTEDN